MGQERSGLAHATARATRNNLQSRRSTGPSVGPCTDRRGGGTMHRTASSRAPGAGVALAASLFIAFSASSHGAVIEVVYQDGFESGWDGWFATHGVWEGIGRAHV